MAGRGYITDNYKGNIKNTYLLTPVGGMESARNPLNKYSTIRKRLDLQGVGPAYSFLESSFIIPVRLIVSSKAEGGAEKGIFRSLQTVIYV